MTTRLVIVLLAALAAPPLGADAETFDPWTQPAHYAFTYRVALDQIRAEADETLRLWVPLPIETTDQRILAQHVDAPVDVRETTDRVGNRMLYASWSGPAAAGSALEVRVEVERRPSHGIARVEAVPDSRDDPARYLERTRRVPLDGLIGQIAQQQSRGLESDAARIRAFYDYVVKSMRYAKHGEGWGHGDAIWACTEKYGNCTDFHSLFLGLSRSQGIAARFHIGFPLDPARTGAEVGGYHCWSDAWDPARGWVPFDASEAWKAKRFDDYFGTLPSDRILFTTGRDLVLEPAQQGEPLNYFIYPYAERGGEPVAVNGAYAFRRLGPQAARREASP